eukprot:Skav231286  [mRNA]  locus=scaffold161:174836:179939:+ [translate_table: standard]
MEASRWVRHKANQKVLANSWAPCKNPIAASVWVLAKATTLEAESSILNDCRREYHVFSTNDLFCAIWAVGTLRSFQAPLLQSLGYRFVVKATRGRAKIPYGLGNVLWAFSVSGLKKSMIELENDVSKYLIQLEADDLARIAWAYAFVQCRGSFMEYVAKVSSLRMSQLPPRHLSNVFWAFAKTSIRWPGDGENSFWPLVLRQLSQFQPKEMTAIAWAAARTQTWDTTVAPPFQHRIGALAHGELSPQELSSLLWSFARLSCWQESVCDTLFQQVLVSCDALHSQHIANLLWTLASTKYACSPLIDALPGLVSRHAFNHIELVSIAASLAKLRAMEVPLACQQILQKCAGELQSRELTGRSFSNLLWAFATLQLCCIDTEFRGQNHMHEKAVAIAKSGTCRPQELSTIAWASVKLSVASKTLMQALAIRSCESLGRFSPQNVANLSWALAMEVLSDNGVWLPLQNFTAGRLVEFKNQELNNLCWSFAVTNRHSDCLMVADALWLRINRGDDILSVLGWTWALHHLQVSDDLDLGSKAVLLRHGQKLDGNGVLRTSAPPLVHRKNEAELRVEKAPVAVSPEISLELFDRLVVSKPAGWEVDRYDTQGNGLSKCPPSLSSYLIAAGHALHSPIFHDVSHCCGFIQRLDVPGSGLILAAKTYQAFYDLQFQQMSGRIRREYVVLCHGWMPKAHQMVEYSIRAQETLPSRIGSGKPSATELKQIACCFRRTTGQTFSLILVRIFTGRTHQIRESGWQPSEVHTAHLGHPTVCDGKYTSAVTFEQDCGWCPRNFLHRYRLVFADGNGQQVEVTEGLPLDLQNALEELEPRDDGWSKEAWEKFVKQST